MELRIRKIQSLKTLHPLENREKIYTHILVHPLGY